MDFTASVNLILNSTLTEWSIYLPISRTLSSLFPLLVGIVTIDLAFPNKPERSSPMNIYRVASKHGYFTFTFSIFDRLFSFGNNLFMNSTSQINNSWTIQDLRYPQSHWSYIFG